MDSRVRASVRAKNTNTINTDPRNFGCDEEFALEHNMNPEQTAAGRPEMSDLVSKQTWQPLNGRSIYERDLISKSSSFQARARKCAQWHVMPRASEFAYSEKI